MKRCFLTILLAGCLFSRLWPAAGFGRVPLRINYQGRMADVAGSPVNLETEAAFSLYTCPSGGGAIWSETQSVRVVDGVFNVLLGRVNPLDPEDFSAYPAAYLGVKMGTDTEMTPRQEIAAVAYSLKTTGISVKNENVGIGTTDPEVELDVAGYLKSAAVAFFARNSSHCSAVQYVAWDIVSHNTGGAYNSANGRFTAPVDGLYHFAWGGINYPAATISRSYLHKNGVNYAAEGSQLRLDSGAAYGEGSNYATIPLAQSDWAAIYLEVGGHHADYGYFTGYLIAAQ